MRKIAFVDRDGTLIEEPADAQIDSLEKLRLVKGVIPAMLRLRDAGFRFVIVTNQDGLGTDAYPRAAYDLVQARLEELFSSQGILFDATLVCPHKPEDRCTCRKPHLGLVRGLLTEHAVDLEASVVIGDRESDLALAENMGLRGYRLGAMDWERISDEILGEPRRASRERNTRETEIRATVDLDRPGIASVSTGIGFLDHMLEQLAKHGGFSLSLSVKGDLEVDAHHTVEDAALCLGETMRAALGDRFGIGRYGFLLPMDEARATVALDLSGRAFCRFDVNLTSERVGELPTEMVGHFFRSLADSLGATLHISVEGENDHHKVEAAFKGVGRAFRAAAAKTGEASLPSTKGVL
ncbi:MAG: bifunctional imidazole glycerol-phosphate dehydratase/histidinol phosphatase [Elusimicrobia bacterium CG1_02_63_36]|nr:MAG: bifunctional imidazole glycerol-phosphate dehydratase/histidinol phosphatase [Elusimicrobia bacterium CG1_02_63_36]PIP84544.1 MAG: bifunctional histidinol-phosphatase/imidazoleglycerol-phosphate dehydratase [Elusimicrobia bacterium CG22_combo_CG10-13_8_21_14_all_63_91]PJA14579.1 MAG: bifunctional histidinol-phosphatase/imidazoleglycerol-phosphate dehydratase [Elusimicrobia bacterium CG_4_10_14_0_2_um_filter_63_34]PJB26839.1 MAG: bifunctional histidinol-phosphatase/imidazoleglycerol-phosp